MNDFPVSSLMIFTLLAALAVAVGGFVYFMRKPSNRHPMDGERERTGEEIRRDGPSK